MRAVLMGILGFILGSAGSLIALLLGYGVFVAVTDYHDFEGGTAISLAYMSPVVALICGIIGAAFFVQISKPRRRV
jgi:hypothetical protein